MSRYMSSRYSSLTPYTPGEQPVGRKYIKLNTNESPFPPSERVLKAVSDEVGLLNLYPEPECRKLCSLTAQLLGVDESQILMTNGSDEILNFAFAAFGDGENPFAFPDITYGFYPVFAELNRIPYKTIPLKDGFAIDPDDYKNIGMNIVIANPNAPTGLVLSVSQIEEIVKSNPGHVVIIDEAYIDFGGESCVKLVNRYENLLVTRTFSKSYSLAGARLGFGVGCRALIEDLNTIKYSTNPYNINRMTMAAGIAAIEDVQYYSDKCKTITDNREILKKKLSELGFSVTDSKANFVFAKHPEISGQDFYLKLKEAGILVRHFSIPEITDYNRITVGTAEQTDALLCAAESIIKGDKFQ